MVDSKYGEGSFDRAISPPDKSLHWPLVLRIIRCLPVSKGLRTKSAFEAGVG